MSPEIPNKFSAASLSRVVTFRTLITARLVPITLAKEGSARDICCVLKIAIQELVVSCPTTWCTALSAACVRVEAWPLRPMTTASILRQRNVVSPLLQHNSVLCCSRAREFRDGELRAD